MRNKDFGIQLPYDWLKWLPNVNDKISTGTSARLYNEKYQLKVSENTARCENNRI